MNRSLNKAQIKHLAAHSYDSVKTALRFDKKTYREHTQISLNPKKVQSSSI